MAVRGVFTSDAGIVGDRKGDFAGSLLVTQPTGSAPLLALSSGMESAGASDIMVTWFEENHLSGRSNVTNNASTGATLIVDDGSFVTPGMIFLVEASGEYVLITSVAGTSLTAIRAFGGTSASAIDGSSTPKPIQRIGTAFEEASAKPGAVANLGFPMWNYMQIFRNEWSVSGSLGAIEHYTGDRVAKNKRDAAVFHAEDIERSLLWGKRSHSVQNGKALRTMNGVISQIATNSEVQSTNVSYLDLRAFLETVFSRNIKGKPNERIAFCGNTVVGVIDTLVMTHSHMNIKPGQTDFGMNVRKWMTPFGDISLLTHPLMNESPLWTKDLYVLHPGAIRMRWLRKTFEDNYDRDGTRAGTDADFGVVTSELSIELRAEICSGKYTGIDTADVSGL